MQSLLSYICDDGIELLTVGRRSTSKLLCKNFVSFMSIQGRIMPPPLPPPQPPHTAFYTFLAKCHFIMSVLEHNWVFLGDEIYTHCSLDVNLSPRTKILFCFWNPLLSRSILYVRVSSKMWPFGRQGKFKGHFCLQKRLLGSVR